MPTDEAKNIELRECSPCPFCLPLTIPRCMERHFRWQVVCECGASGPKRHSEVEAIAAWNSRPAPSPAPQTTEVEQLLHSYHCAYAVDANGDGMPLVDVLTPRGDSDISRGRDELHLLADYLASELSDRLRLALSAPSPADQGAVELLRLSRRALLYVKNSSVPSEVRTIATNVADQILKAVGRDNLTSNPLGKDSADARILESAFPSADSPAVANEARLKEAEGLLKTIIEGHDRPDCSNEYFRELVDDARAFLSPADVARDGGKEGGGK